MSDLELSPGSMYLPRTTVLICWLFVQGMVIEWGALDPLVAVLSTTCFFAATLFVVELTFGELAVKARPSSLLTRGRSSLAARRTWFGLRRRNATSSAADKISRSLRK
jgi:hypothetical protein